MEKLPDNDQELKERIVNSVLEFHSDKGAETKRIITDCQAIFEFIQTFVK